MSGSTTNRIDSVQIQSLLAGLRRRVRAYVWIEGLSLAIVWLGLTFWLAYAIDYWLLVRVFAVEFPWFLRGILLFSIMAGLFYVLYRWILRRAFARLADHSMAVVLERRFGQFRDSLVTSVEMSEHPDHAIEFSPQMLSHTAHDAEAQVPNVRLRDVFNFLPLALSASLAVILVVTISSFALATDSFPLAFRRTYLLAEEQWPRKAEIEIVGISVNRPENVVAPEQLPALLRFNEGPVKVAKGSDIILRVRANSSKVIPDRCVVRYWSDDGTKGSVEMEKSGEPKGGFQDYRVANPPFKSVMSSFRFEVIGKNFGALSKRDGDKAPDISLGLWPVSNREEGYIEVVSSPVVAEASVHYTRPRYIAPSGVPTQVTYGRGLEMPRGSLIDIHCRSNNSLKFVHVHNPNYVPLLQLRLAVSQLREAVGNSRHAKWLADHYIQLAADLERDASIRTIPQARKMAVDSRSLFDATDLWKEHKLAGRIDAAIDRALSDTTSSDPVTQKKRLAHTYRAIAWAILGNEEIEVTETLEIDGSDRAQFSFQPPRLDKDLRLEVSLHDQDDLVSESPYRMTIAALNDEAPKVNVYLKGIGTAVTPDVVIPFRGTIRDDYGVGLFQGVTLLPLGPQIGLVPFAFEAGWLEVRVAESGPKQYAFNLHDAQQVSTELDFRALRNDETSGYALEPREENKLFIDVRAQDRLDLDGPANVGKGDIYQLDIVTADRLLIMLERLESGQRERLQQIRNEMGEAHEFLLRVRAFDDEILVEPGDSPVADREPGDKEPGDKELSRPEQHSVRFSYAVKSLLQTRKSSQEVAGVVDTIGDIREQLINNRVDAEEHKRRLQKEIVEPLQVLIEVPKDDQAPTPGTFAATDARLVELERRLKVMTKNLSDIQLGLEADEAVAESIDEIERLLSALDLILQKLRKIEDYNKLLTYVRELLDDQKELNERTRQRYEKSALQDLLD